MGEIANETPSTRVKWSLMRVGTELRTHDQGVRFAEENGLIPREQLCPVHKVPKKVLREDYTNEGKTLSSATISDWYSYCREVVVIYQWDHQYEQGKIGGPGKTVQIDESKFGRRKYNKGRRVEGHWVLGMIEDGSEVIRLEVCPDNLRTADILIPLIQKHVAEGSVIRTDCWRAYNALPNFGETFFYKDNYNHTANFADVIVEYMWRRSIKKEGKDPFVALIDAFKYVYTLH
ncbi:uncharacterized protein LOC126767342 [Bactrocera neohumeralis]|uniref:uncharacterized protein LOC126767342 n=1 Tax=Bactrocera neohumeralis TaxID=98809 RepID=UPI002166C07F|nr:uncharacterized protein LOC126767342 [Bactrocera neohumeralis]